jgi:dihydropteroate synthase
VVSDVLAFLELRIAFAVENGIDEKRICVDPGIGFGKTSDQNLELLRRLDEIGSLGRPVLVGVSRKSTLGKVVGDASSKSALVPASVAAAVSAYDRGAWMIRAHDVRETVDGLAVAAAVERGRVTA